jgi:hypothetical protein
MSEDPSGPNFPRSNRGARQPNFRVRDGDGWIPCGKVTDNSQQRSIVAGRSSLAGTSLQTFKEGEKKRCKDDLSQLNRLGLLYALEQLPP